MSDEQQTILADLLWGGFVRCPTTGKVITFLKGDDKALCPCRKSNPAVPQERTEKTGTHIVRFLESATAADFIAQEKGNQREQAN